MLLPGDADGNLIKVPFVATARRAPTDAVGEFSAEFEAPLPDRLVGYRDAAGGQHLLDHAQAQREAKIQPMAEVNRVSRRRHPAVYPTKLLPTKPALGQLDSAFFSRRFSSVSSATTSFNALASQRSSLTSSEVAARQALLPGSRNSFD